jgi:CRISPR/Cas system-associated exonuclease Cas4 (RecB family)
MWAGELVHLGVELALKKIQNGIEESKPDEIKDRILAEMRKDFVRSKNGTYRIEPKTGGLIEHEYRMDLTDEDWQDVKTHIMTCLDNFFETPIYEYLKTLQQDYWFPVEKVSAIKIDDTKVYVKPDVLHRLDDDWIRIIDWKTSREDREADTYQLPTYFLYVLEKGWGQAEKIKAMEVNLFTGTIREEVFDPTKIEKFIKGIRQSIDEMKGFLVDPEKNIARKEDFPVVTDPKFCRYCNFQKVCTDRPTEKD